MLRSLFTGISGLSAHQQMLDVTANNIANVNTAGFKSSRTAFQDTLSQTMQGAAGPIDANGQPTTNPGDAVTGGTNALQIGLGVKLAGTALDMEQGSAEATGVATDLQIQGDGFFTVLNKGTAAYTRSGAFHLDNVGHLVTSDGSIVAGATADWDFNANPPTVTMDQPDFAAGDDAEKLDLSPLLNGYVKKSGANNVPVGTPITDPTAIANDAEIGSFVSYSIDSSGTVNAVTEEGAVVALGQITMANFANPNGLEKSGNSQYSTTASSGDPQWGSASTEGRGSINAGYLEMSNVDLASELTNLIIAERGFQANSKSVTTSDQILQTLVQLKR